MNYARVQQTIAIGSGVLLAGVAAVLWRAGALHTDTVVAQACLFAVLLSALRFGRSGGSAAALVATVVYVLAVLQRPGTAATDPTLSAEAALTVILFGLVGIAGGQFLTRLKYTLVNIDGVSALDEWTGLYNQRFMRATLESAFERHRSQGETVAVVILRLSSSLLAEVRASRRRAVARQVAETIRAGVRMVDHAGRLEDGRYIIVLQRVRRPAGDAVAGRIGAAVRHTLGVPESHVSVSCLALPEDEASFADLLTSLGSEPAESQDSSVAYNSPALITLNPADESSSSAEASSTFSTSTAASPQASTKQ